MLKVSNKTSDGSEINSFSYTYDRAGNRKEVLEGNGDQVFWSYDNSYQLIRERRTGSHAYDFTYQYDPTGNRLATTAGASTTTYMYGADNQLLSSVDSLGSTTYVFDPAGNLRTEKTATGSVTTNTWDDENRRTLLMLPSGEAVTYVYDGNGVRVATINSQVNEHLWDGQRYLRRTLNAGGPGEFKQEFTQGVGQFGDLISQRDIDDIESFWYHFDGLGSTRDMTLANGLTNNRYIFDAWGVIVAQSGTISTPFEFIGRVGYYSQTTGGYHVRARTYSDYQSRWITKDPVSILSTSGFKRPDCLNPYTYVHNNPLIYIDASGLVPAVNAVMHAQRLIREFDERQVIQNARLGFLGSLREGFCYLFESPCFGNILGCLCGIIGIIDAFGDLLPGNIVTLLLNIADCACDIWDSAGTALCSRDPGFNWIFQILLNIFSCLLDIADSLLIPFPTRGLQQFEEIADNIAGVLVTIFNAIDEEAGSFIEGIVEAPTGPNHWSVQCLNAPIACATSLFVALGDEHLGECRGCNPFLGRRQGGIEGDGQQNRPNLQQLIQPNQM